MLFLWVLCGQPESPCEGRRTRRIKEFLCSPEIISITSVRGWRERNLLIPTFLKIDLVTGRFQPLTEGQLCGGVTFTASEMLAQCLILCQNSLCLSLGDQPLIPKTECAFA